MPHCCRLCEGRALKMDGHSQFSPLQWVLWKGPARGSLLFHIGLAKQGFRHLLWGCFALARGNESLFRISTSGDTNQMYVPQSEGKCQPRAISARKKQDGSVQRLSCFQAVLGRSSWLQNLSWQKAQVLGMPRIPVMQCSFRVAAFSVEV